jgi:hypothetical protein
MFLLWSAVIAVHGFCYLFFFCLRIRATARKQKAGKTKTVNRNHRTPNEKQSEMSLLTTVRIRDHRKNQNPASCGLTTDNSLPLLARRALNQNPADLQLTTFLPLLAHRALNQNPADLKLTT